MLIKATKTVNSGIKGRQIIFAQKIFYGQKNHFFPKNILWPIKYFFEQK